MKYLLSSIVLGCSLFVGGSLGLAQGTAFTYQGQLAAGGQPANGLYDLAFSLFNTNGTCIGGPLTNSAVAATNGFFTVTLDFGTGVFTGSNVWMEISVSTNGANSFTTLSPRQSITPAPWALIANNLNGTLPSGALGGTYSGTVILANPGNSFTGNGSGLTNLNASALTAGIVPAAQMGSFTNHSDVLATSLNIGDVLTYNGAGWTNGPNSLPSNGSGLTNLNASALTTGVVPTGQAGSLTNHSDVMATNLAAGNVLTYNGTVWTNSPLPSATGGPTPSNSIPVSLVYSGTNIAVNAAAGTHFRLLATNNFLLQNPTGASDAQRMTFEIIQDASGGRTMVLGNAFKIGTDLTFVNLTTNANGRDFMTCICSGTNFYVVGFIKGF